MSGHTPGQFDVYRVGSSGRLILLLSDHPASDGYFPIVDWDGGLNGTLPGSLGTSDHFVANLYALPELLAACEGLRRSDGRGGKLDCWCDSEMGRVVTEHASYCTAARAAIAKARGEA